MDRQIFIALKQSAFSYHLAEAVDISLKINKE